MAKVSGLTRQSVKGNFLEVMKAAVKDADKKSAPRSHEIFISGFLTVVDKIGWL